MKYLNLCKYFTKDKNEIFSILHITGLRLKYICIFILNTLFLKFLRDIHID